MMKYLVTVFLVTFASSVFSQEAIIYTPDSPMHLSSTPYEVVRSSVIGQSKMSVVGEIRTVDSVDQPRLWGKGRAGVVRYGTAGIEGGLCTTPSGNFEYGLSHAVVDWGSAANACPAGTWVCNMSEFEDNFFVCDTDRPEDVNGWDAMNCDSSPIDFDSDAHEGWVAGMSVDNNGYRSALEKAGYGFRYYPCVSLPVWCCSEVQP